jgi:hypothetical protein
LGSCDWVVLEWEAASDNPDGTGTDHYRVDLRHWADGEWESIPPEEDLYGLSVDVSEWVSEGEYAWRVYARDHAGNWSDGSDWLYFECPEMAPPVPVPLGPGTAYSQDPEYANCPWVLEWKPSVSVYKVLHDVVLERRSGEVWEEVNRWNNLIGSEQYVESCSEATSYRWRVRACYYQGNCSAWSAWLYHSTTLW